MRDSTNPAVEAPKTDRRTAPRISIQLPVSLRRQHGRRVAEHAAQSTNIAAGGICFETDTHDVHVGEIIGVRLTLTPGLGYLPVSSLATAEARVVRVETDPGESRESPIHVRVAAQFSRPMKIEW